MTVNDIGKWLKRNSDVILTVIGAGGVVATAVLAVKASKKADKYIYEASDAKGDALTRTETISIAMPIYFPVIMVGAGTIACVLGANMLNRKQQATLISAYTALENSFREYRNKVDLYCGKGTDAFVASAIEQEKADAIDDEPPWDRTQTFYIEDTKEPKFFERTMQQIMQAEYNLNRNFALRGYATFNEFLEFLGLPLTEDGDAIGWDQSTGEEFYGYRWIDFTHNHLRTDDGLNVCSIDMPFGPHPLYECDEA